VRSGHEDAVLLAHNSPTTQNLTSTCGCPHLPSSYSFISNIFFTIHHQNKEREKEKNNNKKKNRNKRQRNVLGFLFVNIKVLVGSISLNLTI